MNGQTLRRRNTALVQSTELDLSSQMLDHHDNERVFCTPIFRRPQGVTNFFSDFRIEPSDDLG